MTTRFIHSDLMSLTATVTSFAFMAVYCMSNVRVPARLVGKKFHDLTALQYLNIEHPVSHQQCIDLADVG